VEINHWLPNEGKPGEAELGRHSAKPDDTYELANFDRCFYWNFVGVLARPVDHIIAVYQTF
jgi:hypothetical protein